LHNSKTSSIGKEKKEAKGHKGTKSEQAKEKSPRREDEKKGTIEKIGKNFENLK